MPLPNSAGIKWSRFATAWSHDAGSLSVSNFTSIAVDNICFSQNVSSNRDDYVCSRRRDGRISLYGFKLLHSFHYYYGQRYSFTLFHAGIVWTNANPKPKNFVPAFQTLINGNYIFLQTTDVVVAVFPALNVCRMGRAINVSVELDTQGMEQRVQVRKLRHCHVLYPWGKFNTTCI